MGKRVVAKLDRKLKTEIRTWLIKFTSVSFDNSESEACWVHGTNDGRQGVPWQGSASFVSRCIGLLIETSLLPVSIGPPFGIGGVCRALKGFYGYFQSLFQTLYIYRIYPEGPHDSILAKAPFAKYHLFSASVFHPKQSM